MVSFNNQEGLRHMFNVKGHITNFLTNCNLTRNFAILQHIVIPIQQVLDTEDSLDRVHAGFSMALSYYTYPAAQAINEPLKTRVTEYVVKHGIQLGGNSVALVPGQIGYSDQKLQEIDSSAILSQQQGCGLLNKKRIMKEENEDISRYIECPAILAHRILGQWCSYIFCNIRSHECSFYRCSIHSRHGCTK